MMFDEISACLEVFLYFVQSWKKFMEFLAIPTSIAELKRL